MKAILFQDGKSMSGLAGWRAVYLLAAGLVLSSALVFIVFGEARVQDWNYPEDNDDDAEMGRKRSDQKVAAVSRKAAVNSSAPKMERIKKERRNKELFM